MASVYNLAGFKLWIVKCALREPRAEYPQRAVLDDTLRVPTFSGLVPRLQSNPLRKITSMAVLVACIVPLRLT